MESETDERVQGFMRTLERGRNRLESVEVPSFLTKLALLGLVAFYLLVTAVMAMRQLWHDELFTYYIAQAPSLGRLWEEIHLDLNPPLLYLATRGSLALLGDHPYAVRLPSILAFLAGSLCLYVWVARRLRPSYGLLAMLAFWSTPFFNYAAEARPYGLIIGFFGMAALAYQNAVQPARRARSTALLGAAVLGMMLSHLFAVFYLAPFGFAELVRLYRRRKPDWSLWTALVIPAFFPFIYIPLVARFEGSVFPVAFQASLHRIASFYFVNIKPEGPVLLIALCAALLIAFRRERSTIPDKVLPRGWETAFILGALAIPAVINLVLMRSHGAFFDRYGSPAAFGLALGMVFFIAAYTNVSRLAAVAAGCVLLLYIPAENVLSTAAQLLHRHSASATAPIDAVEPELPLVAASGLTFLEMDKYASPGLAARLYYLTDTQFAIQYAHATIFEGIPVLKRYFPIRAGVEPFRQFIQLHRKFLVLGTPGYPEDWLLRKLMADGDELKYLGDFPGPYKDTSLYEVTVSGSSVTY
ncbi:MAG TPA: glycosyltransferase family 39 protein [Bryobacteraceae bacterium]|nr:glycosyltransferase family 39 protein [Bryobacteraceae bacterium]